MNDLPKGIQRGERARLFPILADRSIEGRTLSIFLATLTHVRPFAERLLAQVGRRIGPRARIEAFTEVSFQAGSGANQDRPDGLLIIDTGHTRWTALVEAKVRKSEIGHDQLERYLRIAKDNGIDAVITLSNQFSLAPHHHPVAVTTPKAVDLFHLSWMRVLTDAFLLLNEGIENDEHAYVLNEFKRFISHDSAGVESFTQMPPIWSEICETVQTGGNILVAKARECAVAWHQECQDLSLIFSRQIDAGVTQRLARAEASDPSQRISNDADELKAEKRLSVELEVPDAASDITVCADFMRRNISASMYLSSPADKKRSSARVNWLLRQLPKEDVSDIYIRAQWPGRSPWTQLSVEEALDDPSSLFIDKGSMELVGFEVVKVVDLGHRFSRPRAFIEELEDLVPSFYEHVGQNLQAWVRRAPRITDERTDPEAVSPSAISD